FEHYGLKHEYDLLDVGESYEAVVTSINDEKKVAGVLIGAVKVEIPMSNMDWAKEIREEPGWRPPPKYPSQVLKKGDVVLVRIAAKAPVKPEEPPVPPAAAAAEESAQSTPQATIQVIGELDQEPQVQ